MLPNGALLKRQTFVESLKAANSARRECCEPSPPPLAHDPRPAYGCHSKTVLRASSSQSVLLDPVDRQTDRQTEAGRREAACFPPPRRPASTRWARQANYPPKGNEGKVTFSSLPPSLSPPPSPQLPGPPSSHVRSCGGSKQTLCHVDPRHRVSSDIPPLRVLDNLDAACHILGETQKRGRGGGGATKADKGGADERERESTYTGWGREEKEHVMFMSHASCPIWAGGIKKIRYHRG